MSLVLAAALLAVAGATTLQLTPDLPTSTKLFIVDTPEIIRREYQAHDAKNIYGSTLEIYSYIDGEGKLQTINYEAGRRQSANFLPSDLSKDNRKPALTAKNTQEQQQREAAEHEELARQRQLEALQEAEREAVQEAELRKALEDNLRARTEQAREESAQLRERAHEQQREQARSQAQHAEQARQRDSSVRQQQTVAELETAELLKRARAELMAMLEASIARENAGAAQAVQAAGVSAQERLRLGSDQQRLRLEEEQSLRLANAERLRLETADREQRLRLAAAQREVRLQQVDESDNGRTGGNNAAGNNNRHEDLRMTTFTIKKSDGNERIIEPLSDLRTIYTLADDNSNTYLKLGNIAERRLLNLNLEDEIRVPVNSYYTLVSPTAKYSVATPTVLTTLPRLESIRLGNRLPISLSTSILKQSVNEPTRN